MSNRYKIKELSCKISIEQSEKGLFRFHYFYMFVNWWALCTLNLLMWFIHYGW